METEEQKLAINKEGENIIVSAGAGSGKTMVLSKRVLRKVLEGVPVDHLLVLTFTREAAKEMSKRIRNRIKENLDKNPSLIEQLNKLDNSYITTFDSFSLSIVRKYHYLINVKKDINIIDSNVLDIKINEILDSLMEEEYIKREPLFTKLISDFCIKDDYLIKDVILKYLHKLDMKYDKDDYLDSYIDEFYNPDTIKYNINLYLDLIKNKIKIINNLLSEFSLMVDGDYYSNLYETLEPLLDSSDYISIKNNIPDKLPNLPRGSSDEVKEIKERINSLIKEIRELVKYNDEEELFDTYMLTKDYVIELISLIKKLDQRINEYKYENDLYDFIDISKLAIKLVNDNPDIRKELKEYFNEILVDEYQDTNDLQEYFINLISNNNVYMVGDIKQSIYRFRNANPDIFRLKYNDYSKHMGGFKIDLLKNFRSRSEVLDNVNLIFDYIMDDYIGGANYIESHRMVPGNINYDNEGKTNQNNNLEIYTYEYDSKGDYKKEEIEAFIIANDIKNKVDNHYLIFDKDKKVLREANYSDFTIIIDRTKNFDLYKKIFLYKQIPLSIYRDEYLTSSELLLVIKSIFKLIDYHLNNKSIEVLKYSFLSIGRSFLFNYDDKYLFKVIKDNAYSDTEIISKINNITNNINSKSLSMILDDIINEFDIIDKLNRIGNILDNYVKIDYLYSLCNTLNTMGYTYLDFVEFLDKIFDGEKEIKFSLTKEDNSSVKIINIHKSKGLEYSICYFPGLDVKFNDADIKDSFIYDNMLGMITPYYKEGIGNTFYRELFKKNYKLEDIGEKIRLFYVALTRVKEKMIFVIPDYPDKEDYNKNGVVSDDKRLSYNKFSDILSSIKDKINIYEKMIDLNTLSLSKDYNLFKKGNVFDKINKTNEVIKTKEFKLSEPILLNESHYSKTSIKLNDKDTINKMNFGTKIHYYLEVLDFNNPDYSVIPNEYQDKIKSFLESDLVKNIKSGKVYKEYEFIYNIDNEVTHGIIDLLIEYPDHFDIIDYKLKNIDDINYDKQLNGYRKYIEDISNKKVNCYLYSIIDSNYREVDK